MASSSVPHVVIIPYPAQGHVTPMLHLGKLLHFHGLEVTFVNTDYNHRRMLRSAGTDLLADGIEGFRFEAIPDGMPPTDKDDVTQDIPELCLSMRDKCGAPFRELLLKLNSSPGVAPVSCVIADLFTSFAVEVAKEVGVVALVFMTTSACGFMCYLHYFELIRRGYTPFKGKKKKITQTLISTIMNTTRPHAVLIPQPAQGHVTPMLQLAKLLHSNGFYITFVNSDYNHRRLLKSRGPHSLDGLADFRFEAITDGLPLSVQEATQDIAELCVSTAEHSVGPFRELLTRINCSASVPEVTCVVADGVMSFARRVAEEMGILGIVFWTTSACGFMGYIQFFELIKRGYTPLKDESYFTNGYLETVIDWIPGMKNIRLKDIPSFIRTTDPNDTMLNFDGTEAQNALKSSGVILNTFDALEQEIIDEMKKMFPNLYTIGPLIKFPSPLNSIGSNLWKEEPQCLEWLNGREAASVVYVNFGSITVMTSRQLEEFAWGLANSKNSFLWVVRPDLVAGGSVLSEDFVSETRGRGILVSWCPQEEVLSHPSVGVFLTHSGWNSTLESICGGVPMICWPFFAEQPTNCRYVCENWEIGMEVDGDVRREDVERMVREMMGGEKGKGMRLKARDWKAKAEEAARGGGTSYRNLNRLIHDLQIGNFHVAEK